jgi:hypothetical protein
VPGRPPAAGHRCHLANAAVNVLRIELIETIALHTGGGLVIELGSFGPTPTRIRGASWAMTMHGDWT